jgi:hypothetical protein
MYPIGPNYHSVSKDPKPSRRIQYYYRNMIGITNIIFKINIYNINGQKVAEHMVIDLSIPVVNLSTGMYFVEVVTNSYSEISKFVKK